MPVGLSKNRLAKKCFTTTPHRLANCATLPYRLETCPTHRLAAYATHRLAVYATHFLTLSSLTGAMIPRSVTMAEINSAGVTSKAGL